MGKFNNLRGDLLTKCRTEAGATVPTTQNLEEIVIELAQEYCGGSSSAYPAPEASGHPWSNPKLQKVIKNNRLLTHLMAAEPTLHWPNYSIDNFIKSHFEDYRLSSLLAASACGKTSGIYRGLSVNYGLFLNCTLAGEIGAGEISDELMKELHRTVGEFPQGRILLEGIQFVHISIISALLALFIRSKHFLSSRPGDKIPPSIFLDWQLYGNTDFPSEIFKCLSSEKGLVYASTNNLIEISEQLLQGLKRLLRPDVEEHVWNIAVFVDEAQNFAKSYTLRGETLSTNGNVSTCGILALLLQALLSGICSTNSILLSGTAFNSDVIAILQSTAGEGKGFPKVQEFVGHDLVQSSTETIGLLKVMMPNNLPKELEAYVLSPPFGQFLPLRRRLLSQILLHWFPLYWDEEAKVSKTPSTDDLHQKTVEAMAYCCKRLLPTITTALLNTTKQNDLQKVFAMIDFLSCNPDSSALGIFPEVDRMLGLRNQMIDSGFCSYYCTPPSASINEKDTVVHFATNEGITRGTISLLRKEHDFLNQKECMYRLLKQVYSGPNMGCIKQEICDLYFGLALQYLSLKYESFGKIPFVKNLEEEFQSRGKLSPRANQKDESTLSPRRMSPRNAAKAEDDYLNRSSEKPQAVPGTIRDFKQSVDEFFKSPGTFEVKGVINNPRSFMIEISRMFRNCNRPEREALQVVYDHLHLVSLRKSDRKIEMGSAKRDPDEELLQLGPIDGSVAFLMKKNLDYLLEGFIFLPSSNMHFDGFFLVCLDSEAETCEASLGLVAYGHKLLTSSKTESERTRENLFSLNRNFCYLTSPTSPLENQHPEKAKSVFQNEGMELAATEFRNLLLSYKAYLPISVVLQSGAQRTGSQCEHGALLLDRQSLGDCLGIDLTKSSNLEPIITTLTSGETQALETLCKKLLGVLPANWGSLKTWERSKFIFDQCEKTVCFSSIKPESMTNLMARWKPRD